MASKKVTLTMTLPGVSEAKEDKDDDFLSPEWVNRNKHRGDFQAIVKNSWDGFIINFTNALQQQYRIRAKSSLNRSVETTYTYQDKSSYWRAKGIPNSARGHKVDINKSDTKGEVSGLLFDTMTATYIADGNNIKILSPLIDSRYKQLVSKLQGSARSYHLARYLNDKFGFQVIGEGTLTSPFKEKGSAYNFAMKSMNQQLLALQNKGKRGKYKKRRKR